LTGLTGFTGLLNLKLGIYAVIARSVEGVESDVAISGKSLFTTKDAKLSKVRQEFFTDD